MYYGIAYTVLRYATLMRCLYLKDLEDCPHITMCHVTPARKHYDQ